MQIGPLNPIAAIPAVDPAPAANEDPTLVRQLATAVRALNKSDLYGQDTELRFARDPGTRALVIKVVQPTTGEVITQIPPEEVLRAAAALEQYQTGKTK